MTGDARRSEWLSALAGSLRGPPRARRRLLLELEGHLEDAIEAELGAGVDPHAAEAAAVARLGPTSVVAERWNSDTRRRRWQAQIKILTAAVAVAAVAAPVGLAQRPGSANRHHGRPAEAVTSTSSRQARRASPSRPASAGRDR
jgi:hypothetical protein